MLCKNDEQMHAKVSVDRINALCKCHYNYANEVGIDCTEKTRARGIR